MFDFPIYSPVQQITFNVPNGMELFIKRDDLIDPLISGNKWRKLKYTLQRAISENKTTLVSFGGAYSNHLLALASASAKFKFEAIAFVRGDEIQQKESEMLIIARLLGMKIIRVSREEYKNKQVLFDQYFANNMDAFFIDEGGLSAEGRKGCEDIIDELDQEYSDIFLAAGTGCTTAGIINAIERKNLNTHVHTVVVHKGTDEVKEIINKLSIFNQLPVTKYQLPVTSISILDTKERYGKHTPELLKFCIEFQRNTGIMLDPIYTGKAMMKCYEWMNENQGTSAKILFIHTGGLMGNIGKLEAFLPYLT